MFAFDACVASPVPTLHSLLTPAPPFCAPACLRPHPCSTSRGTEGTHHSHAPLHSLNPPSPLLHRLPHSPPSPPSPSSHASLSAPSPFHSERGTGTGQQAPSPLPSTRVTPPSPRFTPRPTRRSFVDAQGRSPSSPGSHAPPSRRHKGAPHARGAREQRGRAQGGCTRKGVSHNEATHNGRKCSATR